MNKIQLSGGGTEAGAMLSIIMGQAEVEIYKKHVFVCTGGKTCPGQGSDAVLDALRREIHARGLRKEIRINKCGCLNQCGNGPMAVVYPESVWYAHLTAADAVEIVEKHLVGGKPVERCLYDGRGRIID